MRNLPLWGQHAHGTLLWYFVGLAILTGTLLVGLPSLPIKSATVAPIWFFIAIVASICARGLLALSRRVQALEREIERLR